MNFEHIIFTRNQGVATITLNHPEKFNALDIPMGAEIITALENCLDEREIRAVIITGAGKAFCSGGDLTYFQEYIKTNPGEPFRQLTKYLNRIINTIRLLEKPVIAAINGAVSGAGIGLALSCDLRIAAATTKFKQAYTSVGLAPDGAWSLFVSLMAGPTKASEMIFLDPVYDARQALELGLVNHVVALEELMKVTNEWAAKLSEGPTKAFAIAKAQLNNAVFTLLERQLELERQGIVKTAYTEDYKEGISTFFAKRKPFFKGR